MTAVLMSRSFWELTQVLICVCRPRMKSVSRAALILLQNQADQRHSLARLAGPEEDARARHLRHHAVRGLLAWRGEKLDLSHSSFVLQGIPNPKRGSRPPTDRRRRFFLPSKTCAPFMRNTWMCVCDKITHVHYPVRGVLGDMSVCRCVSRWLWRWAMRNPGGQRRIDGW